MATDFVDVLLDRKTQKRVVLNAGQASRPFPTEAYFGMLLQIKGTPGFEAVLEGYTTDKVGTAKPAEDEWAPIKTLFADGIFECAPLPALTRLRVVSGSVRMAQGEMFRQPQQFQSGLVAEMRAYNERLATAQAVQVFENLSNANEIVEDIKTRSQLALTEAEEAVGEVDRRLDTAEKAIASAVAGALATPGLTPVATMAEIPLAAGVYRILRGVESGQVYERTGTGTLERRQNLETAPASTVFGMRRVYEATLAELRSGLLDPGSMTRIFDEAGPLRVVTNAGAGAVNNVDVYQLAGDKKAVRDYSVLDARIFGFAPSRTETQNTTALADIADWQHTHMGVDVPNMAYGGAKIILPPGMYHYGDQTVPLRGNVAIEATHPRGSILTHHGTGHALLINGTTERIAATPPNYDTASVYLRNLVIRGPEGKGVFIGSAVLPFILFDNCEIREIKTGYALSTGERVYFLMFMNGSIVDIDKGIYHAPYGDLLMVFNSKLGVSAGALVVSEGPTLRLVSNNFEGCADPTAFVHIRPGDIASTYAVITHNRFGQEFNSRYPDRPVAPYDIAFLTNNASKHYQRATIAFNDFITAPAHEFVNDWGQTERVYQKECPIVTNLALGDVKIRDNQQKDYKQGEAVITTLDPDTAVIANSQWGHRAIVVDRPESATTLLRGITSPVTTGERRLQSVLPNYAPNFPALTCVGYSTDIHRLPVVQAAKFILPPLQNLGGLTLDAAPGEGLPIMIDVEGSIVRLPIPVPAGTRPGDPVWVGANAMPTLTRPDFLTRQVAVVLEPNAAGLLVRIQIGKALVSATMPTTGHWVKGALVDVPEITLGGAAGSQYRLYGWERVTTGEGHVLGVDWIERRMLTGT